MEIIGFSVVQGCLVAIFLLADGDFPAAARQPDRVQAAGAGKLSDNAADAARRGRYEYRLAGLRATELFERQQRCDSVQTEDPKGGGKWRARRIDPAQDAGGLRDTIFLPAKPAVQMFAHGDGGVGAFAHDADCQRAHDRAERKRRCVVRFGTGPAALRRIDGQKKILDDKLARPGAWYVAIHDLKIVGNRNALGPGDEQYLSIAQH